MSRRNQIIVHYSLVTRRLIRSEPVAAQRSGMQTHYRTKWVRPSRRFAVFFVHCSATQSPIEAQIKTEKLLSLSIVLVKSVSVLFSHLSPSHLLSEDKRERFPTVRGLQTNRSNKSGCCFNDSRHMLADIINVAEWMTFSG